MSLVAAGFTTAAFIGTLGVPVIIGPVAGVVASSIISISLNWEWKSGSISKKIKDGVHSTFNTVAGWFK